METMKMSGGTPSLGIQSLGPDLGPSGHLDDFSRRNLPPFEQWPQLRLDRPEFRYPDYLNAAVELTDRNVEKGFGDRVGRIGQGPPPTEKKKAAMAASAPIRNWPIGRTALRMR
jgi:2-aminobenzoate-CoA ligase